MAIGKIAFCLHAWTEGKSLCSYYLQVTIIYNFWEQEGGNVQHFSADLENLLQRVEGCSRATWLFHGQDAVKEKIALPQLCKWNCKTSTWNPTQGYLPFH